MAKRILLCLSHSIEEHDQLKLLSSLGYEVASIGGYIDPAHPHDPKRPPLPQVKFQPFVKAAVDNLGTADNLGEAQRRIPPAVLDWLGDDGIIIYHHYLGRLFGQWDRIRDWMRGGQGRRVIWRSVGQSVSTNEEEAAPFRADGLERVAYSPKEANIPGYTGHDALIRFYVDPDEWSGWTGEQAGVLNVTQHLYQRSLADNGRLADKGQQYTSFSWWDEATSGLPRLAIGPGSEPLYGPGQVSLGLLRETLRKFRVYGYTGTQPASYTLALLEALATGIPVVSIGPSWMRVFPYGPDLFEGHLLAARWSDDPQLARLAIRELLEDFDLAAEISRVQRNHTLREFGRDKVAADWQAFLG